MITFFKQVYPLLERRVRRLLVLAGLSVLGLAVLEALALATMVPLMQILTAPNLGSTSTIVTQASQIFGNPTRPRLAAYLGSLTISLYIVKSLLNIVVMRWITTFSLTQEADMVHRLMRSYLHAAYREHLAHNSAEFLRTLNSSVRQIFGSAFVQGFSAVGDLFSVLFVGAVLVASNPVLAVAAGLYFATVSIAYQLVLHRILDRAARKLHEDQATDFRNVHQALAAVKEVKVRGTEEYFADEVYRLRRGLVGAHRTFALASITPRYVLELAMVGAAGVISLVAFSTQPISTATATVAVFVAGGYRMMAPLNKVMFGISQAKAAMPSIEQVRHDLEVVEQQAAAVSDEKVLGNLDAGHLRPSVLMRDVVFSYAPGTPVLRGVTLSIEPGEAIGLVGSSGAGKSTLLDVLLGLLDPDSGDVLVDGRPLASVRRQWQQMIGYVPQSIALFDDTVKANIALGLSSDRVDDEQLWRALGLAQLEDVVRSLPEELDTFVGEGGVRLSGGQRQRLGVARALFHSPQVLMFDEATSALDSETEFRLTEILDDLRGQMTTITIAHRLSTVRRCDRVIYLEQGKVVADGTFAELNATLPSFARLVELSVVQL